MEPYLPPAREQRFDELAESPPEVVVVGGGITGCGVALDLALRGVRTLIVERDDWAGATSSASSRLVHGGLRYLEQFEFGLVRESCLERALLLRNAAGLVWPERFTFPVRRGDRVGRAKLAAGLWLYTAVSVPRVLGLPSIVSRGEVERRVPGIASSDLTGGGSYLDGATDDARLTLAVALAAMQAGALALSRVEVRALERGADSASLELLDTLTGATLETSCRAVVLAGGPFTDGLRARAGLGGEWVRPTRGTHVLVPRERLPTDGAVTFVSRVDGRVMFLIPWPRHTVIGTTDLDASADEAPCATREEVDYLLASANAIVPSAELGHADVHSSWAGLRPLLAAPGKDPSARSREERVERDGPYWTIAGGKLTGYRAMAEGLAARVVETLGSGRGGKRSPTREHRLRGAHDVPVARPAWSSLEGGAAPTFPDAVAVAWQRRYASLASAVGEACRSASGGLEPLDRGTLAGEVDWAVESEDCLTAVDFLARRTDAGHAPPSTLEPVAAAVVARMANMCGWDDERLVRERAAVADHVRRAHGWRDPI